MPKLRDIPLDIVALNYTPFEKLLVEQLRAVTMQVNGLSEGRLYNRYQAQAAKPTTGSYAVGDIVWNLTPAELGVATAKYVLLGWVCTGAGAPGTLLDIRTLTGN